MSTVAQVLTAVAGKVATITTIKRAPTYPEEQLNVFPFAVIYASSGDEAGNTPGERISLMTVTIELHVARQDMPRDITKAIPYGDSIPDVFFNDVTIGGVVSTFEGITWTFGALDWGAQKTLGYRFLINGIKRRITL